MYELNIDELLKPISADKPCGEDLSYDLAYAELDRLMPGKPEQEMGNVKVPAEEPDWKDIFHRCTALMKRTKDLRVMVYLTLALTRLRGVEGVRDGLQLIHRHMEAFWPQLMPPLDPDDNNDPTLRVNAIASMSPPSDAFDDPLKFPQRLLDVALAESRQLGNVTLRQLMVSTGELAPSDGDKKLDPAAAEAAFSDTPPDRLSALFKAATESLSAWNGIDQILTSHVGAGKGADLRGTQKIIQNWVTQIQKRVASASAAAVPAAVVPSASGNQAAATPAPASAPVQLVERSIESREDCIKAIDDICKYLESAEPSSPVPMILKRARKLISKSFLDVIADLSPDALKAIKAIGGVTDDKK